VLAWREDPSLIALVLLAVLAGVGLVGALTLARWPRREVGSDPGRRPRLPAGVVLPGVVLATVVAGAITLPVGSGIVDGLGMIGVAALTAVLVAASTGAQRGRLLLATIVVLLASLVGAAVLVDLGLALFDALQSS
jgi:hypothetical protein